MAEDFAGNVYVVDIGRMPIVVDESCSTLAGIDVPGFRAEGGLAGSTPLGEVTDLRWHTRELMIADKGNRVVWRLAVLGDLLRLAGMGEDGWSGGASHYGAGETEPGLLDCPHRLTLGPDGELYIADTGQRRVWRIARVD